MFFRSNRWKFFSFETYVLKVFKNSLQDFPFQIVSQKEFEKIESQ